MAAFLCGLGLEYCLGPHRRQQDSTLSSIVKTRLRNFLTTMSTNDDASDNNGTLRRHHVRLSLCISRLKASLKSDGDGNQLIEALPCYEQPQPSHSFVMMTMIMMTLMTMEERERVGLLISSGVAGPLAAGGGCQICRLRLVISLFESVFR